MFPKNPNPTLASTQYARPEQSSMNPHAAWLASNLNEQEFARVAMHPEERAALERREAATISLSPEHQPLQEGWLSDVNNSQSKLEFNDEWVDEARVHEPTNAERISGADVALIGLTRKDFDLAV